MHPSPFAKPSFPRPSPGTASLPAPTSGGKTIPAALRDSPGKPISRCFQPLVYVAAATTPSFKLGQRRSLLPAEFHVTFQEGERGKSGQTVLCTVKKKNPKNGERKREKMHSCIRNYANEGDLSPLRNTMNLPLSFFCTVLLCYLSQRI